MADSIGDRGRKPSPRESPNNCAPKAAVTDPFGGDLARAPRTSSHPLVDRAHQKQLKRRVRRQHAVRALRCSCVRGVPCSECQSRSPPNLANGRGGLCDCSCACHVSHEHLCGKCDFSQRRAALHGRSGRRRSLPSTLRAYASTLWAPPPLGLRQDCPTSTTECGYNLGASVRVARADLCPTRCLLWGASMSGPMIDQPETRPKIGAQGKQLYHIHDIPLVRC